MCAISDRKTGYPVRRCRSDVQIRDVAGVRAGQVTGGCESLGQSRNLSWPWQRQWGQEDGNGQCAEYG